MSVIDWFFKEYPHTENSDFCSMAPDKFMGFSFRNACKIHDHYNRGVKVPGRDKPANLWELQCVFWKLMTRTIIRDVSKHPILILPHFLLGWTITFIVWLATLITFPFWYRMNTEN